METHSMQQDSCQQETASDGEMMVLNQEPCISSSSSQPLLNLDLLTEDVDHHKAQRCHYRQREEKLVKKNIELQNQVGDLRRLLQEKTALTDDLKLKIFQLQLQLRYRVDKLDTGSAECGSKARIRCSIPGSNTCSAGFTARVRQLMMYSEAVASKLKTDDDKPRLQFAVILENDSGERESNELDFENSTKNYHATYLQIVLRSIDNAEKPHDEVEAESKTESNDFVAVYSSNDWITPSAARYQSGPRKRAFTFVAKVAAEDAEARRNMSCCGLVYKFLIESQSILNEEIRRSEHRLLMRSLRRTRCHRLRNQAHVSQQRQETMVMEPCNEAARDDDWIVATGRRRISKRREAVQKAIKIESNRREGLRNQALFGLEYLQFYEECQQDSEISQAKADNRRRRRQRNKRECRQQSEEHDSQADDRVND